MTGKFKPGDVLISRLGAVQRETVLYREGEKYLAASAMSIACLDTWEKIGTEAPLQAVLLARALTNAANLREASFDQAQADELAAWALKETLANPDNPYAGIVDYSKCYKLTLLEACKQVDSAIAYPVYLLLTYCWNDALEWAKEVNSVTFKRD